MWNNQKTYTHCDLELKYKKDIDYKNIELHFKKEIDRILEKEVGEIWFAKEIGFGIEK